MPFRLNTLYFQYNGSLQDVFFLFQPFVWPKGGAKKPHEFEAYFSYSRPLRCEFVILEQSFRVRSYGVRYRCVLCDGPGGAVFRAQYYNSHYSTTSGIRRWNIHLIRRVAS